MNIQHKDSYTLVSIDEGSYEEFQQKIADLNSNHLVVEVSENLNIDESKILLFLNIASNFKSNGMSFVVIKSGIDIDDFPENLNIVPTLQEAEDIMEMEAIERDLGF
ncbi:hypothetical protein AAON49_11015 [Pseudotenacibaculum sp. MALMAid0570]|uniref:hypothetical protein n=1 Tax=Pseudotenacibaculum sp. MALMAid0570 TaxID=3143938 RepID=UPI0032DEDB3E